MPVIVHPAEQNVSTIRRPKGSSSRYRGLVVSWLLHPMMEHSSRWPRRTYSSRSATLVAATSALCEISNRRRRRTVRCSALHRTTVARPHRLQSSPIANAPRAPKARHGAPRAVVVAHQPAHDSFTSIPLLIPTSLARPQDATTRPRTPQLPSPRRGQHPPRRPRPRPDSIAGGRQGHFCLHFLCPYKVCQNQG